MAVADHPVESHPRLVEIGRRLFEIEQPRFAVGDDRASGCLISWAIDAVIACALSSL
jgi:hypothetical protein